MHHVEENQPFSLAYRMVTSYQLAQVLQMNILNMIPHVRNALKARVRRSYVYRSFPMQKMHWVLPKMRGNSSSWGKG
jgi:hypothetical protein